MLGGLTTDEIARAFLVPEATVAQRIVRAKRCDGRAAHRSRQAHARRRRCGVRTTGARRVARAARIGARSRLPDLQRRLFGDRRR
ncbi:MAG TPA: sigma factor-like helix-turn-helix DNA-binding protein [Solimonas sp.]